MSQGKNVPCEAFHINHVAGNITVGYEMTVYTTTEGQGMVELCAVVTSHPGGAPRAFTISATTRDGTAGSAWSICRGR